MLAGRNYRTGEVGKVASVYAKANAINKHFVHAYTQAQTNTNTYTHKHTNTNTQTSMHSYTHIHTCAHTHTHTHTHTHKRIQTHSLNYNNPCKLNKLKYELYKAALTRKIKIIISSFFKAFKPTR